MRNVENYDDIMIRDCMNEDKGRSANVASTSVDIIPYGQNILSIEEADRRYGEVLYDGEYAVVSEKQCNCYVRAKNISKDRVSEGTVKLFLMPFNVFTNPQKWYKLNAYDSSKGAFVNTVPMVSKGANGLTTQIQGGQVCLNKSAFLINDDYHLKAGAHYCLCAVVDTPYHKIQVPGSFQNNLDVDRWVLNNPNVALLNVSPVNLGCSYADYSFQYGNFSNKPANFILKLTFMADYKKGERWSANTAVRIQCTDSSYPFTLNYFIPEYNPVTGYPTIAVPLNNVPANFYVMCTVYLTNPLVSAVPAHGYVHAEYLEEYSEVPREYEDLKNHFIPVQEKTAAKGAKKYLVKLGECFAYNKKISVHKLRYVMRQNEH